MDNKQTRCPECKTVYQVTIAQLTAAQGVVCCPKCTINFNGLTNLVQPEPNETLATSHNNSVHGRNLSKNTDQSHPLAIFERRIENSNVNLVNYLNNQHPLAPQPMASFPAFKQAQKKLLDSWHERETNTHGVWYYLAWSTANLALLLLLAIQVVWFKPGLLNNSPMLTSIFQAGCNVLGCQVTPQYYHLLTFNKLNVKRVGKDETRFSGVLINHYEKSLPLPPIKLTLIKDGQEFSHLLIAPKDYLISSLSSVQKIPQDRPFKFEFRIDKDKKTFDDYKLEIVHP